MLVCFQELARERQQNLVLLKAHQDKDALIGKLKDEIDLLNRVSPACLGCLDVWVDYKPSSDISLGSCFCAFKPFTHVTSIVCSEAFKV